MIPYGRQDINADDIRAVTEVLESDFLTQGPMVPAFERSVASLCGVKHALAMNSATSALHVACLALGIGPGDRVWTSPVTFVASANCALYCGASVDFVDIDPVTYNMSPDRLAEKLAHAEQRGCLPKAVIPVHLCGQSCDMEAIADLGRRYGFRIIEDASHAIGGSYQQRPVGYCQFSDITVFSFHPVKIITTGEGGMAVTNDAALAGRMEGLRSHGITRDPERMTRPPDGPWYYQQLELGYNYRMTDIQAALGVSQMRRLEEFVARRNELADRYDERLARLPLTLPYQLPEARSARHLYVIRVPGDPCRHLRIFKSLREAGIGVNLHYIPVHLQPYYERMGFHAGDFPEAECYYTEAISLPMYSAMTDGQQDQVCDAVEKALFL